MNSFEEYAEEEQELTEVMTRQQRIKRGKQMRRMAKRMQIKRKRTMKRKASMDVLRKRVRKAARKKLAGKFLKGADLSNLTIAQKEKLEKRLKKIPSQKIDRIARKMLPGVKERERKRVANMRKRTGGDRKDLPTKPKGMPNIASVRPSFKEFVDHE